VEERRLGRVYSQATARRRGTVEVGREGGEIPFFSHQAKHGGGE